MPNQINSRYGHPKTRKARCHPLKTPTMIPKSMHNRQRTPSRPPLRPPTVHVPNVAVTLPHPIDAHPIDRNPIDRNPIHGSTLRCTALRCTGFQ